MRSFQRVSVFCILAILLGLLLPQPSLTQGNREYFEDTKHWVEDEFLEYFNSQGGLRIFGYPISERFVDRGLTVQYFQKARMEFHPNNPDPYKVQLGLLGDQLNYRQSPIGEPPSSSRRKVYFPQTGHTVSYAFLDYFKANGEIDVFGYPISEMHFEDGQIVQYFQRLKMEWHPDDATSNVRIGDLGLLYTSIYRDRMPAWAFRPADSRIDGNPSGTTPTATTQAVITDLRVVVSLRYSVMSKKRTQTVTVHVTDDNADPVPNAIVSIGFSESASGKELAGIRASATTNNEGYAVFSVPVNEGRSGTQIVVRAKAQYGELSKDGQNVFLLWW